MPLRCAHFRLSDFAKRGEHFFFANVQLTERNLAPYHDHDYQEVFWVKEGQGMHLLNGTRQPLKAGQLWLIRPQDRHQVVGDRTEGVRVVQVAFSKQVWRNVRRRYFADRPDPFESASGRSPRQVDASLQSELDRWSRRLALPDRLLRVIDGFLMELLSWLQPREEARGRDVPEWLGRALREFSRPQNFAGGTRTFARLAGRSPSHVARETVRFLGKTPTELVNEIRMDHLANQLTSTHRPILELSLDCGLDNLSHAYALFRRRFGMTPRRYRLRTRRMA